MRTYERLFNNNPVTAFIPHFEGNYLYFSLAWFFLYAFILFILTFQLYKLGERLFRNKEYKTILFVIGIIIIIAFILIQFYPLIHRSIAEDILKFDMPYPPGRHIFMKQAMPFDPKIPFLWPLNPPFFPRPLVTEHIFVLITVILSVVLIRLVSSRHQMILEFEKLKTEKLQTSYNALMGQINPHFFFNSLNGLNSLIRSGEQEQTLKYLNELSSIFRYVLQSNKKELVTLAEELQFTKAYTYLLSVRYEGKLFFTIHAESSCLLCYLPILSILPLVENAVKHNIISKQYPLQVDIYTDKDKQLVVSNQIQPKTEENNGSGIGLRNLWARYQMLTGKDISISQHKGYFKVTLPLLNSPVKL
ncbi:MAG: histidine kinase [Tannerella sp.]|jgi:hypothetical protein|nr:histidine kinase [Tannerella sp.]